MIGPPPKNDPFYRLPLTAIESAIMYYDCEKVHYYYEVYYYNINPIMLARNQLARVVTRASHPLHGTKYFALVVYIQGRFKAATK